MKPTAQQPEPMSQIVLNVPRRLKAGCVRAAKRRKLEEWCVDMLAKAVAEEKV